MENYFLSDLLINESKNQEVIPETGRDDLFFQRIDNKLSLCVPGYTPVSIDFCEKPRRMGGQDLLIRAVKPCSGMTVIDATAGYGKDALVLALRGANVLMLERQPIMIALLSDAKHRLSQSGWDDLNSRLHIIPADAINYLEKLEPHAFPDVIYLDPMHPERTKTAQVKKNMQILQQLWGADQDVESLIHIACQRVKQKVVLKWPVHAQPIGRPSYSYKGKKICFWVYV